ncbi:uncharacterized protein LOC106470419 isoform X2 [Limulus polyphemus]|uniref:Centromere protein O n=1 Tax=Limulus polyphemus TaxID=6850 RepID=A0ABM1TFQ6_LIMPO|nr:uncharacterized protein LOC106470419 isoform X2 [Limulus polyphemus]
METLSQRISAATFQSLKQIQEKNTQLSIETDKIFEQKDSFRNLQKELACLEEENLRLKQQFTSICEMEHKLEEDVKDTTKSVIPESFANQVVQTQKLEEILYAFRIGTGITVLKVMDKVARVQFDISLDSCYMESLYADFDVSSEHPRILESNFPVFIPLGVVSEKWKDEKDIKFFIQKVYSLLKAYFSRKNQVQILQENVGEFLRWPVHASMSYDFLEFSPMIDIPEDLYGTVALKLKYGISECFPKDVEVEIQASKVKRVILMLEQPRISISLLRI